MLREELRLLVNLVLPKLKIHSPLFPCLMHFSSIVSVILMIKMIEQVSQFKKKKKLRSIWKIYITSLAVTLHINNLVYYASLLYCS